jgi:hypothetical protein
VRRAAGDAFDVVGGSIPRDVCPVLARFPRFPLGTIAATRAEMRRVFFVTFASLSLTLAACSGSSDDASGSGDDSAVGSGDAIGGGDSHGVTDSRTGGDTLADGHGGDSSTTTDSGGGGDTGPATMVNPPPGSPFFVGTNFWNIDWEGADDYFVPGTDFATTTNPWQPQLLTDLAPYHVIRFMDWNMTNDSGNPQAHWATRKLKTQKQDEPVAFEWQIDLCNRTKKDYWLNVSHEATSDDWTKVAQLVHDTLDPSLRVYLEFSNEVWNGGFPQNGYATDQAKALGLPGSWPAGAYYVYASVRLYETFEGVFGKGSPRLVKVLAGQAGWSGPCGEHMTYLKDTTINPKGTMPDAYAIAPYFSGTSIDALKASLPDMNDWVTSHVTCVKGTGLPIISYEGGQDSFAAGGSGCEALQTDPAMHDIYTSFFDGISAAGMKGPFMQYTHTGSCWGLKKKTSDATSAAPKYEGVLDWIAAHP